MDTVVTRNIHPVGQGGFASEIHGENKKLLVYDCGVLPKSSQAKTIALTHLPEMDIDALFISHFDEDHISLIPDLTKNRKVKTIVMPYLSKKIANQISVIFESSELASIITTPSLIFGDETIINFVKEFGEEPQADIKESDNNTDSEKLNQRVLISDSGTPIDLKEQSWEYIPFNVASSERRNVFFAECQKLKLELSLLDDLDYLLSEKSKLKKAYKAVPGGINQNSMILYSGSVLGEEYSFSLNSRWMAPNQSYYGTAYPKEACLYTGDYDGFLLDSIFNLLNESRVDRIGTIQIPHHGSPKSWNNGFILKHPIHWFVQFGEKNKFGHPSLGVISSIEKTNPNHRIFMVTESFSSGLRQYIECNHCPKEVGKIL